jgi:hypothetical protein
MTLEQYLKTYAQGYNHDNAFGEQCVDWFRGYCKFVLEIAQPAGVKGAYQFWDNRNSDAILKNNFDAIENTATTIPQYGDVVIWGIKLNGEFGHVAICVDKAATVGKFISSDQNWQGTSTQANQATTAPALVTHNYNYVVGFLRPKNQAKVLGSTSQESTTMTESAKKFYQKIKGNIRATGMSDDPNDWDQNTIDNVSKEINDTYSDKASLAAKLSEFEALGYKSAADVLAVTSKLSIENENLTKQLQAAGQVSIPKIQGLEPVYQDAQGNNWVLTKFRKDSQTTNTVGDYEKA